MITLQLHDEHMQDDSLRRSYVQLDAVALEQSTETTLQADCSFLCRRSVHVVIKLDGISPSRGSKSQQRKKMRVHKERRPMYKMRPANLSGAVFWILLR